MSIEETQARLAESRSRLSEVQQVSRRLEEARQDAERLQVEQQELLAKYQREQKDVDQLKGHSLASFYHWLLNDKREALERERDEMLEAKIRLDAATEAVEDIGQRVQSLEARLASFEGVEAEVAASEKQLEALLSDSGSTIGAELDAIGARDAELMNVKLELEEASRAGIEAWDSLAVVAESLNSASNWGTFDLVGGGMLATYVKHEKMRDAQTGMVKARSALEAFGHELEDVNRMLDHEIDLDGLTSFADYFFDGLLIDWFVQSKINNAKSAVEHARQQIQEISGELDEDLRAVSAERAELSTRRREILLRF